MLPHLTKPGEEMVELNTCFSGGLYSKYGPTLEYFSKLVELFAALSGGKNYLNANSIGPWFSNKCLLYNLWNQTLSESLRANIAKLFSAIYIDSYSKLEGKRLETVRTIEINYKRRNMVSTSETK